VAGGQEGFCVNLPHKELDPGLYVVGTPIGNLEDVTLRALRVLRGANAVLAEDTRRTGLLLKHFNISTPMVSCHSHNEAMRTDSIIARLAAGEVLALVSDAGMPLVSDPGGVLVAAVLAANLPVVPVPGPCAAVAGLVGAGLPADAFTFVGFLPGRPANMKRTLSTLAHHTSTLVMYVGPHDLLATLRVVEEVLGDRRCCVARELTKIHEEFWRGTLTQAHQEFKHRKGGVKGEITLLVEGCSKKEIAPPSTNALIDELAYMMSTEGGGLSASTAAREVATQSGMRRNEIYKLAIEMNKK